jgi:glycosyltransferase involved in cell wall biosynthesis
VKFSDWDYLRRLASERSHNSSQAAAEKDFQDAVTVFHYVESHLREQLADCDGRVASLTREIATLNQTLASLDARAGKLTQTLAERDGRIATLVETVAERDGQIVSLSQTLAERERTISAVLRSRSWKLTWPLRFMVRSLRFAVPTFGLRLVKEWWIIRRCSLFDAQFYIEGHPDVTRSPWGPLWHYLLIGAKEGHDPHPIFSTSFYSNINGDVAEAGINPLYHYLRCGALEGRDPHPLFDSSYYLEQYPDVAKAGLNPLEHYLKYGGREGYNPHPLFDSTYYLEQYPDVAKAGLNPLEHYLKYGGREGYNPHPLFDSSYYLEQYPDVAKAGLNPLEHYLKCGGREGRNPHPLFDSSYYLKQYPDVAKAGLNPLEHYLTYGGREGRNPHPLFDSSYYLEQYPDVAKTGLNPLEHYLRHGGFEGYDPHPQFDSRYYLSENSDVSQMRINPLVHYVGIGIAEGRDPNTSFDTSAYLEDHADVAMAGLNPLVHFLANPSPFDLRAALHSEFRESERAPLDSEHDSHPVVSVIIACSNQSYFLEGALLSCLLACSHPMEIIVVDDGSADSQSVALIDKLAEEFKFILIRQVNAGAANTRYAGIQRARGEFIQFLDADDLLAPGKIDIQIEEFRSNSEIDICVSEYELCDANGLNPRMLNPSTIAGFSFSHEDFVLRWGKGFFVPIHCALMRRNFLGGTIFESTTKPAGDDQAFWVELASRLPKFKIHPAVLAIRRFNKVCMSTNKDTSGCPMVSIVIRCYNYGRYLDDAVQSVLNQTYQNFEIIVIDDGSTDSETIRILDNYSQPKTKLIRTTNQGLSAALNNGITAGTGKYILPLDADDKIDRTYLEKGVRVLEENEKIGIVYCKADFFGEASGPWELPPFQFPEILLGNRIFITAFFRRLDWEKVGGYDPRMIYGWEDHDFWLSLIELGREVHCIPETLFFYRKHGISTIVKMNSEHHVYSFAQLFRNHPKLYVDNIAHLLNERPDLWLELDSFIQGRGALKDARLKLAWNVVEDLVHNGMKPQFSTDLRTLPTAEEGHVALF